MQVSNLLRTVLKPRGLPTSSKKPPGSPRGNKREGGSQSIPPKASCLCSPTNHAGSFRCRLHRSSQRWGSRSLSYCSQNPSISSARTSSAIPSLWSTFDLTSVGRTLPRVHPRLGIARHQVRPSRLSRMVNAKDLEAGTRKKVEKATSQKLGESAFLKTFLPGRSTGIDPSTNFYEGSQFQRLGELILNFQCILQSQINFVCGGLADVKVRSLGCCFECYYVVLMNMYVHNESHLEYLLFPYGI